MLKCSTIRRKSHFKWDSVTFCIFPVWNARWNFPIKLIFYCQFAWWGSHQNRWWWSWSFWNSFMLKPSRFHWILFNSLHFDNSWFIWLFWSIFDKMCFRWCYFLWNSTLKKKNIILLIVYISCTSSLINNGFNLLFSVLSYLISYFSSWLTEFSIIKERIFKIMLKLVSICTSKWTNHSWIYY